MKDKPWLSIQPRKLRQNIDGLLSQLKELPARLRQYASYEYVKRTLQGYAKVISQATFMDGSKVSMLIHTYPNKPMEKIKGSISSHKVDDPFYFCHVCSVICRLWKEYLTPNVLTETRCH